MHPEATPESGPDLSYEVSIARADFPEVRVRAHFSNLDAQSLSLWLPDRIAFARLELPLLEELRASTLTGEPLALVPTAPYRWRLVSEGRSEVQLEYRVPLVHREQAEVREAHDEYEFPYLADDHGLLVAGTLFVHPEGIEPRSLRVDFQLPEGWPVLAPWRRLAPNAFALESATELADDLIAIGHWDVQTIQSGDFEGTVAFAPGQEELAGRAAARIEAIVRECLGLFGCTPRERYLFLFGHPGTGSGFGGSPKTGSMTLMASAELPPDIVLGGVSHLVAHEFHHVWLRAIADTPDELRFYNEGFTDYYAHVVPARLGLLSPDEFARQLGRKLASYEEHARHSDVVSLAEAGGPGFFDNPHDYALVYDGGLLLAALLDLHLRRRSPRGSLDRFQRAFNNGLQAGETPTLAQWLHTLRLTLGHEGAEHIARLVRRRTPIDWAAELGRVGVVLERRGGTAGDDPSLRMEGRPPPGVVFDVSPAAFETILSPAGVVGGPESLSEPGARATARPPGDSFLRSSRSMR